MRNTKHRILFLLAFFFLCTKDAFANVGTPLMWAGMLHLVLGNAFIGITEGLLIAKIFKVRKRRSIWIMILANYISMIAGSMIVGFSGHFFSNLVTIYWLHFFLLISFVIVFVLTIFIEWPFCYWLLKVDSAAKKHSLKASLYAQVLSYGLLIPFYLLASGTSLLWNVKIEKTPSFAQTNPWIYFISEDGNSVRRIHVAGGGPEKVVDVKADSEYARLFPKKVEGGNWGLWLKDRKEGEKDYQMKILDNFSVNMAQLTRWDGTIIEDQPDSWFNFGVVDYRSPENRDWKVSTGFWAIEGLRAKNDKGNKDFYIALETPFLQWFMRNVTILPKDQVVFQMGSQIVLLDLETHKLCLITKGRGPLVTFED